MDLDDAGDLERPTLSCGVRLGMRTGGSVDVFKARALPLMPVWPWFAIDCLFYSALFLCGIVLAVDVPRVVRQRRLSRRGRCPACGYDLRGELARGCPECGWRREQAGTIA